MADLLIEYLESLIDTAAEGNANDPAVYARDIQRIFERGRPQRKIYIISSHTRYDDSSWDVGTPADIEIVWEAFDFDTKYGEPEVEDVESQIQRLEELQAITGEDFSYMIKDRVDWILQVAEEEAEQAKRNAETKARKLEEARKVLREAGELEVPDGATPENQA